MRLSQHQIREILIAHNQGLPHSTIARTHNIDTSTVRYHVEKTETLYGTTNIYAVVAPKRRACNHPSLKCLVCGMAQDHIHRRELEQINQLEAKLERANEILARFGYSVE